VDQEGEGMTTAEATKTTTDTIALEAHGLTKRFGNVEALRGADFELREGEILAVIGDNGAGKSTLIKCLSGAHPPDEGQIRLHGEDVQLKTPLDARALGIETVYQTLAVSPALDIASNLFLGREPRAPGIQGKLFRKLDKKRMREEAARQMNELGIMTIQNIDQQVETLSGGQRQGVAVARAAAFGSRVLILDEPTAALGVKESARVLDLIKRVRDNGLPVIIVSHNMPHVFEIADRIHIQRLGRRVAVVTPKSHTMTEVVAIMTGATEAGASGYEQVVKDAARSDPKATVEALGELNEP
jgi:fructose transport system ATP-binding protein